MAVQHYAVRDHDHGVKQAVAVSVVDGGEAVRSPCNRIGLPGARRMLDQIVFARAVPSHVCHKLPHHIVLMVAWEDHFLLCDHSADAVFHHFFFFLHEGNKAVNQVQQAVPLKDLFPQIACGIAVRILRITRAAGHTCAVGTLIERQKTGVAVRKLRRHPYLVEINGKIDQKPVIQTERELFGAAVILILVDRADIVLHGKLILELQRHDRNAVYGQRHVNGVGIGSRIPELAGAAKDICLVAFYGDRVQIGFRLEKANLQLAAHILDAIAENIQKSLTGDGLFQSMIQLVNSLNAIILGVSGPFLWLRLGDEFAENVHVDALGNIVLAVMYPVPLGILPAELRVTTCRRNQEGFDIPFKPLFAFVHHKVPPIF